MARTVFAGTAGAVKISDDAGVNYETLAELRAWSVEESSDTIEFTRIGSTLKGHKTGYNTWSATADLYLPADDVTGDEVITVEDTAVTAIAVNTEYTWEFYIDSTLAGKYTGKGIVTGVSRSLSHDGMVEMSVTIQGSGDLT